MAEGKATTIRFSSPMYERLELAGQETGLPINSIVVVACLEWLDAHQPMQPVSLPPSVLDPRMLARMKPHGRGPSLPLSPSYAFDRFTDRAKHAFIVAQEEAGRAGLDYIDDEHLLIAMAVDPDSLATRVLLALGINPEQLREAAQSVEPVRAGVLGKLGLPTSNTRRVIEAAFKQAKTEGDQYVGTPHLLVALVSEPDTTAAAVLGRLGVSPEQVRVEVLRVKKENPQLG